LKKIPIIAPFTAARYQHPQTRCLRFAAKLKRYLRQVFGSGFGNQLSHSVEPVNATLSMPGCAANAAPAVCHNGTILTTLRETGFLIN